MNSYLINYLKNSAPLRNILLPLLLIDSTCYLYADEVDTPPIQEVFLTELVYPQEQGEIQMTLAPQFSKNTDADANRLNLIVEYGITDQWQFEVELTPYINVNSDDMSSSGSGDIEIATKYTWMNVTDNLHIAVLFEIQFPAADINKKLTEGFIEYEPSIIVAKDFPDFYNLQLFMQTGFSFVKRNKTPEHFEELEPEAHEYNLNLGFFMPRQSFTWTTELNWSTNRWNNDGEENTLYLTPGGVWMLWDIVEVGLGVPLGLTADAEDYKLKAMFTLEWD